MTDLLRPSLPVRVGARVRRLISLVWLRDWSLVLRQWTDVSRRAQCRLVAHVVRFGRPRIVGEVGVGVGRVAGVLVCVGHCEV